MISLLSGNALLALAAALLWGGGDFSGGMGAKAAGGRSGGALRVVLLSHAASGVALVLAAKLLGDQFPQGALLGWGLFAGAVGGLSLVCFYTALSRGAMGASAALSGLLAAAIPAVVGAWAEGSPGVRRMVGFAVAGVAIWLIAGGPGAGEGTGEGERKTDAGTLGLAVTAGVGFGIYFVALKMASPAGLVWPMATARMGSLSVCSLVLVGTKIWGRQPRETVRIGRRVALWVLCAALLDTSGNLMFLAATRAGRLDVAAVLASLYPASTILLAALLLGERPTRRQGLGMVTALAAVVLIAG